MMAKENNNNKAFGLKKERELKKKLQQDLFNMFVSRSRGSFGAFDIECFSRYNCFLISVKATRQKTLSMKAEIKKLEAIKVPNYCKKLLYIWWTPRKDREKRGWEIINIR